MKKLAEQMKEKSMTTGKFHADMREAQILKLVNSTYEKALLDIDARAEKGYFDCMVSLGTFEEVVDKVAKKLQNDGFKLIGKRYFALMNWAIKLEW